MTYEERTAWAQGVVAVVGYAIYVVIVLSRARERPLAEVPYMDALLWTIGAAILAGIVVGIIAGIGGSRIKDQRDRQIYRLGESVGGSFITIGALGALVLALVEADWFWIANVLYLSFALSMVLSTIARILVYRRGLPAQW